MSEITIEKVTVNVPKFKQVRGDRSVAEYADYLGFTPDMVTKIERGDRWRKTLERFAAFCQKTNQEPNNFFEIVKKIA